MTFSLNKQIRLLTFRTTGILLVALLATIIWTNDGLLTRALAKIGDQDLTVAASFAGKQSVRPNEPIELRLSRQIVRAEGKIAIIVGTIDLTSLFSATENVLKYNSRTLPLTLGETEVIVYLVSPDNIWNEIARFPLRVAEDAVNAQQQAEASGSPTTETASTPEQKTDASETSPAPKRFGFEKLDFTPALTLSLKSQPAQSSFPEANRPARATFTDFNIQGSLRSETARGSLNSQTQFDFVGSSFQDEALRFGELGTSAPQVDLASYLMQFQTGRVKYGVGHVSFGTQRHLMNGFSSRGVTLSSPINSRFDFAASLMNGSTVVGFSNFFGLNKRRHQILSGALGAELVPKRPGGVRVEIGALEGWLLPVGGATQGVINDAERSRGVAVRVVATDPTERFKLDGGFTRSEFTSPSDPQLEQGVELVAVPTAARNARYLDVSYDLLKDFALLKSLLKGKKINLTIAFRHETVDPLFRSLGASTQADKTQNEISINGTIGEINAQVTHQRFNDNLANIPSILKSNTRRNALVLGTPLASLFGPSEEPSTLLPRVSYTFDETHQFSLAIPIRGGFELDPSSIPDQIGTNQSFTSDWQMGRVRFGYRLNHTLQDNRQAGRELADTKTLVNGFALGISPHSALDINLDINADSAHNVEDGTTNRTLRLAPAINWRMVAKAVLTTNFSITLAGDAANTKNNKNIEFDLQWTYQFGVERDRFRKVQGQFFMRYANSFARSRDNLFGLNDLTKSQTLNAGLSFTFF